MRSWRSLRVRDDENETWKRRHTMENELQRNDEKLEQKEMKWSEVKWKGKWGIDKKKWNIHWGGKKWRANQWRDAMRNGAAGRGVCNVCVCVRKWCYSSKEFIEELELNLDSEWKCIFFSSSLFSMLWISIMHPFIAGILICIHNIHIHMCVCV